MRKFKFEIMAAEWAFYYEVEGTSPADAYFKAKHDIKVNDFISCKFGEYAEEQPFAVKTDNIVALSAKTVEEMYGDTNDN